MRYRSIYNGTCKDAKSELSPQQIKQLENLGMIWDVDKSTFNEWLPFAKEFYASHKNLKVPYNYMCERGNLYTRVSNWKKQKDKLTASQIKQLEEIGMVWNKPNPFEVFYHYAIKYYNKHYNINAPYNFKFSDGYDFGRKIAYYRDRYRSGKLSKEQINKLEALKIKWAMKNKNSAE